MGVFIAAGLSVALGLFAIAFVSSPVAVVLGIMLIGMAVLGVIKHLKEPVQPRE